MVNFEILIWTAKPDIAMRTILIYVLHDRHLVCSLGHIILIDAYGKMINLVSSPEVCGPGVGEAFTKADKAIRKILVSNVMREFEDSTRANMKSEVAGLGKLVFSGLV